MGPHDPESRRTNAARSSTRARSGANRRWETRLQLGLKPTGRRPSVSIPDRLLLLRTRADTTERLSVSRSRPCGARPFEPFGCHSGRARARVPIGALATSRGIDVRGVDMQRHRSSASRNAGSADTGQPGPGRLPSRLGRRITQRVHQIRDPTVGPSVRRRIDFVLWHGPGDRRRARSRREPPLWGWLIDGTPAGLAGASNGPASSSRGAAAGQ